MLSPNPITLLMKCITSIVDLSALNPNCVFCRCLSRLFAIFCGIAAFFVHTALNNDIGLERLLPILAKGGKSGTIKDWYAGGDLENNDPYVFAKTGTIRNVHCLSGFLKAKSGRWYVFSFMHNNFPGASSTVKRPMGKVLKYLRSNL